MKSYRFYIVLFLFFADNIFSSNLEKSVLERQTKFIFSPNKDRSVKYNLVEIMNPFFPFYYYYEIDSYKEVNQISFLFKNDERTNFIIVGPTIRNQDLWVRVSGIINLVPGGITMNPEVDVKRDYWSTSLKVKPASVIVDDRQICCPEIKYSLYAVPMYPAGNVKTWSIDYLKMKKNQTDILISAINSSSQFGYLRTNADLIKTNIIGKSDVVFTVANRFIRDFLLIIVASGPDNSEVQYPPVHIKGCLSMKGKDADCKLITVTYPMYIVMGGTLLFFCLAFKYDLFHVFFCCWITVAVITLTLWQIVRKESYIVESSLYVICLGIAPAFAIASTSIGCFMTKRYNRLRMFFTAFVITLIFLAVMWFTPLRIYKWNNLTLFIIVTVVVASVLQFVFSWFNYLTMFVGSMLIVTVLLCLSISINNLNASIIPFIFIDFYNSIVYPSIDWIYYSPLLIEDLIIVILCPILTIIFGLASYVFFKNSLLKEKRRKQAGRNVNLELRRPTVDVIRDITTPQPLQDLPPQYNHLPTTSNNIPPNEPPPSYDDCAKMLAVPSAPVSNSYIGPCLDRF